MAEVAQIVGLLQVNQIVARITDDEDVVWAIEDSELLDRLLGQAPVRGGGPYLYYDRATLTAEIDAENRIISRVLSGVIHAVGDGPEYRF